MSALIFLLLPACAPEIQPDPAGCPARNAWYLDANGDGVADGTDVYVGCEAPGDEWILTPPFGFEPTDTGDLPVGTDTAGPVEPTTPDSGTGADTSAPTTTADTSAPTTTADTSAPTTTADTSAPTTTTDTSAPTTTDTSAPTTTDTSVATTTDTSLPTGTGATP